MNERRFGIIFRIFVALIFLGGCEFCLNFGQILAEIAMICVQSLSVLWNTQAHVTTIFLIVIPYVLFGSGVIRLLWQSLIMENIGSILHICGIGMLLSTSGYLYLFGIGEVATPLCLFGLLALGIHGVIGLYSFTRSMLAPKKTCCC